MKTPKPKTKTAKTRAPTRRQRYKAAIELLDEWLADDSGYDEKTWPILVEALRKEGAIAPNPKKWTRFVQGKHFDAWAWEYHKDEWPVCLGTFGWFANTLKPERSERHSPKGRWVRVRFVVVEG